MKPFLLFLFGMTMSILSLGQISGMQTIPGSVASIADAILILNASGGPGPGGVIFNVAPGYNELITAPLQLTATGTSSNPIVFRKDPLFPGPNPLIVAGYAGTNNPANPAQDGIFALVGSDYVTIDGIDLQDPNLSNPASMEYGYALFKKSDIDGCQFNTIQNCTVTLWRGNNVTGSGASVEGSRAINVVNALIITQTTHVSVTAPTGSNSENHFYGNTLQNCNYGITLIGFNVTGPSPLADQNNDIGGTSPNTGNTIVNFGGAVSAANPSAAIRTQNQYGMNISYNNINNNNGGGVNHPSTLRGLFLQSAPGAGVNIGYNNFTITGGSTTSQISVIENASGSTAAGNTISIHNNIISNCTWPTATSGVFYGIYNSATAATVSISDNQLINITHNGTGLCYLIRGSSPQNLIISGNAINQITKLVSGTLYAFHTETAVLDIHDNSVSNMTMNGGGNAMYGIYNVSSPTNESYHHNHFWNLTNNGTGGVFGIYTNTAAGTRNVYGNTIHGFNAAGGGPVYGIYGAKSTQKIYQNRLYDLTSGTTGGIVYGIYVVSGDAVYIYNNFVSDLKTPAISSGNVLSGIFLSITAAINVNVWYNTVYLSGTSTGSQFHSAALNVNTAPTLDLRNNILVNECIPTGTGIASAYKRSSTNLLTYSLSSDHNDFYVPGTSPGQVILYDGTATYPSFSAYQTLVGPVRDAASFTENPPFSNIGLYDYHIDVTVPTQCESGGIRVTAPLAVVNDYDIEWRWGEPLYTGTGSAPDVGADEFNGLSPRMCLPPTNITIMQPGPQDAIINWIAPIVPPSAGYELEVRTSGDPGSGPIGLFLGATTMGTSFPVNGLSYSTTYYVYLRSNCSGVYSIWTPPQSFTTPVETIITGVVMDSLGAPVPSEHLYIVAHNPCNPNDTLTTLSGGITLAPGGQYTVHCNQFINPPAPGEPVIMSFFDVFLEAYSPETVIMQPTNVTLFSPMVYFYRNIHLPVRTSFVRVVVPPHKTLQVHYTYVNGCGNTDVFEWNGQRWIKFRQWNWNHYCTWRYIQNTSNVPKIYVIHNDNGNIWFQLTYHCPVLGPTSPSNYSDFALFNMGWRDRPLLSCEFGNIVAPVHSFIDYEGAFLDDFPARLGSGGVGTLNIQFQSYDNMFWSDMQMMVELAQVTQPGTLELYIPDASIPFSTAIVQPGDTAVIFNTGGIPFAGTHLMTLTAGAGLSVSLEGMIYTTVMPIPEVPVVTTAPVTGITWSGAVSGGNVTDEGGAPVTAKGVCWSTSPNPTLLNSFTVDGSGPGVFTSHMTGLLPSTVYFVRAYATNMAGTSYGNELSFTTTPMPGIITGTVVDSTGMSPAYTDLYIVAHTRCNPNDSLSTLTGGITYSGGGGGGGSIGTYTINCSAFLDPPLPGDQVFVSFYNMVTHQYEQTMIEIQPGMVTTYNSILYMLRSVYLPYRTSSICIAIPPHRSAQIHYTYVVGCGNTDVSEWTSNGWVKIRQWNFNHYCTWRYITNNSNTWKCYRIHNDNGTIRFALMFFCPYYGPTSPSNNYEFALIPIGWRDRPYLCSEFGNIVAPAHLFVDNEGASLTDFPSRIGAGGVESLTIQFESYDNMYWGDMNLLIDLDQVTQPGELHLSIPDADLTDIVLPVTTGDTAVQFYPGGILNPGIHTLTLSALGGLSMGIDAFNFTSLVPIPDLPTVTTAAVSGITQTSAVSGGTVVADGGAPVIARGVCWNTSPNPTILNNHTTDGTGLGVFTSNISGLAPATTYHVRAYATNSAGTAYGEELIFVTLPAEILITGTVYDSTGLIVPSERLYIVASNPCNPNDTLTTLNGGITLGSGGEYTVHCNQFIDPPQAGDQVIMSFFDVYLEAFTPEAVELQSTPITVFNPVLYFYRPVHLPFKTSFVRVMIPPHKTLQVHYTYVNGCGNTDVFEWNGQRWIKFRQWNWNHYCTWRYIQNSSNYPKFYTIHNDNGNIWFDLTFHCPVLGPTSPSNYSEFALFNMGWRDRPFPGCEFGNIQAVNHTFVDAEGAYLDNFPSRLGTGGVQHLTIQFETYNNVFWNDMELMVELENVTAAGTLQLYIPDAAIQVTNATISPGDTACFFHTGGISVPGIHQMILSASASLSAGIDGMIYTTLVPIPDLPTVNTTPVTSITWNSAISGGTVTNDGGAFVTARGVCWSTTPAPTILNPHTTDGTGLGTYVSNITGLTPSTTYYVRAYATNLTGTAYGQEMVFTTQMMPGIITGTLVDSAGYSPLPEHVYIVAHTYCNPNDTLSTYNGGITYTGGGGTGTGTYTVNTSLFLNPPLPGDQVMVAFYNTQTAAFDQQMIEILPGPVTLYNCRIFMIRQVLLPYRTSSICVAIPPHRSLQIHYTYVAGCGNTDVAEWNGTSWIKIRQWNWNHYCTWKYISNNTNSIKFYRIHNDNGIIRMDLMYYCPYLGPTSPSNYSAFALLNFGWRDRPVVSCEFGNIVTPVYTFFDFEGASLGQFPSRIGSGGVEQLNINFESYNNDFWSDMNLMIDLDNVTQPGSLQLTIPGATVPSIIMPVNTGDTVVFFNPGGIMTAGTHTMTLTALQGLSAGMDAVNFTSMVPVPDVPTVVTTPVTSITANSAVSGGNVTGDGGAAVTGRGVCWSTSPNPTILNNHTSDGAGMGSYVSLMTGLMPSTTYYVRAYATNLAGTGYGNEFMFSTYAVVPEFRTVQNITVSGDESVCYDATSTIYVAGGSTYFTVLPGGSAIFAAGIRIHYYTGTHVLYGGSMHGYIDPSGTYCNFDAPLAPFVSSNEVVSGLEYMNFILFPNPTTGDFTLEQKEGFMEDVRVEIYSMTGERVMKEMMSGERKHLFRFSTAQPGLYFVKVVTTNHVETFKLMKVR